MAARYCFTCAECGYNVESDVRDPAPTCSHPGRLDKAVEAVPMRRDYRAENVGATGMVEMKRQREQGLDGLSGKKAYRDLFLPTAEENRTREDPTGERYIRRWNDEHEPRPTNKTPLRPDLPDGANKTFGGFKPKAKV